MGYILIHPENAGFLHGKTKLRRICRWCKGHINELMQYMPMPSGIPSVSTMSRVLSKVDEELVSAAVMNWICQIVDTRGKHIAIDGKGLRASASKINGERTPYILNAIDVSTRLVIGQLAIREKTNDVLRETALEYRLIRERFDGKIIVSGNGRRSLILLESESDYEKIQILFLYIVSVDYDTYRDQESIHTCTGG